MSNYEGAQPAARDATPEALDGLMTDEQIENLRTVLVGMLGPYAMLIPKKKVQAIHDKMQSELDSIEEASDERRE